MSSVYNAPRAADVARLAGVSASAVSRTFRPGGSASKGVRAKVHAAASALGYHPNAMARAMSTRRSGVIGVVMAADTIIYYPEVLKELTGAIGRIGLHTMLFMLESLADADKILSQILSYKIDGVVALCALDTRHIATLHKRRIPLVLYNRIDATHVATSVTCDHYESGQRLARYLMGLGHRRFGLIDGPAVSAVGCERMAGVRDSLASIATHRAAQGDYSYVSGRSAMTAILTPDDCPVTAVIAANDMMALGALDYARTTLKLPVPQALSFVGFDGIGAAGWEGYELVTMRQPVRLLVDAVAKILLERIDDPDLPSERRVFATQMVAGSTVGNARHDPFQSVAA